MESDAVTLYLGDCLEILPTLGTECLYCEGSGVDTQGFTAWEFISCKYCNGAGRVSLVVITDPPYGLNFPYATYSDTRSNLISLVDRVMPILQRLSTRIFVLCGTTQITLYPEPTWICVVSWNTTGSFGAYGYNQWTPILCYGPDISGFGNVNGVTKTDVLTINGGAGVGFQRKADEKLHTCPKPYNMMQMIVNRFTSPGDIILDPFMGSGTTGVACVRTGRRFIGIEIDPGYFAIAQRRIAEAQMQPPLFPHDEPGLSMEQARLDML